MRTTVTLDDDVSARLQVLMQERSISFKRALNETLRAGLAGGHEAARPYRLPTYSLGVRPDIDLDRALRLDASLEDEEIVRKLNLRK
jgi:hypothetical protein